MLTRLSATRVVQEAEEVLVSLDGSLCQASQLLGQQTRQSASEVQKKAEDTLGSLNSSLREAAASQRGSKCPPSTTSDSRRRALVAEVREAIRRSHQFRLFCQTHRSTLASELTRLNQSETVMRVKAQARLFESTLNKSGQATRDEGSHYRASR